MANSKATIVGGFVLGAMGLAVAGTLVFSSLHYFKKSLRAVVVFKDSVAGLAVGSPVTFRGVKIGQVAEMRVHFDFHDRTPVIPVFLSLEPGKVVWRNSAERDSWNLQDAVAAGLRAQLTQQSLVTGLMSVDLDLHPGAAAIVPAWSDGVPEIPTIPSEAQMLKEELLGLNLQDLGAKTRVALASLQHTLDELGAQIEPLASGVQATLHRYDRVAESAERRIDAGGAQLDVVLKSTDLAMTRAGALLASLDDLTARDSPTRADFDASLRDLAVSAASLREFTHDLQRNPAGTLLRRPPR